MIGWLLSWQIFVHYGLCGEEDVLDHLFVGCSSKEVWTQLLCRFPDTVCLADSVQLLIGRWHRRWTLKGDRLLWWLILYAILQVLWGERNSSLFKRVATIFDRVVSFILGKVREWTLVICNVGSHNYSFLVLLGG